MIDRVKLQHIDWVLIGLLLLNTIIGVAFIYSSSHYLPGNYHIRQILWAFAGMLILFILLSVDYNMLIVYSSYFYAACILFLLGIMIFGKLIAGTKSWIKMPFFQIQPSEITKIAVILILVRIFSEFKKNRLTLELGMLGGGLVVLPILLVAMQPDLGTALSYIPILLGVMILAGINRKVIIILLIIALAAGILGWNFFLKDYQKQRITTLIFPQQDPHGSGYQLLQSKIAVGSGGFLGKGYKKGTQSQLRFLPARHTDFLFSVIGEELGFVGITLTLLTYFLLLSRIFKCIYKSRDRAGVYLVFLVFLMLASQFLINVLMTVGLFPVAGIPLPLLSYGGSSLITNFIAVSLVLNVKMRQFVNV